MYAFSLEDDCLDSFYIDKLKLKCTFQIWMFWFVIFIQQTWMSLLC